MHLGHPPGSWTSLCPCQVRQSLIWFDDSDSRFLLLIQNRSALDHQIWLTSNLPPWALPLRALRDGFWRKSMCWNLEKWSLKKMNEERMLATKMSTSKVRVLDVAHALLWLMTAIMTEMRREYKMSLEIENYVKGMQDYSRVLCRRGRRHLYTLLSKAYTYREGILTPRACHHYACDSNVWGDRHYEMKTTSLPFMYSPTIWINLPQDFWKHFDSFS